MTAKFVYLQAPCKIDLEVAKQANNICIEGLSKLLFSSLLKKPTEETKLISDLIISRYNPVFMDVIWAT